MAMGSPAPGSLNRSSRLETSAATQSVQTIAAEYGGHWSPSCELPPGLVRPRPIDPTGVNGPTKGQARGPGWRQTSSGLYVPAEVSDEVVEQRILEQGQRICSHGAVTAWAALRWRGAAYFDGLAEAATSRLPVPLVVGRHRLRPDPRVEVSRDQIAPTELTWVAGIFCATVQRALFDQMRYAPSLRTAVVAMEMAAAARLISVRLMRMYVAQRSAWQGVELVRRALAIAIDTSRSPQETLMRLVWLLDAGLPAPLCNVPVFDLHGRLLGIPDLLDPVAGMIGEYDGAHHKARKQHRSDVRREGVFRDHGLEYFAVVGGDLLDRPLVVSRMHSTRARALFEPEERRHWTLTPPPWWKPREEPLDRHLLRTGQAGFLIRT